MNSKQVTSLNKHPTIILLVHEHNVQFTLLFFVLSVVAGCIGVVTFSYTVIIKPKTTDIQVENYSVPLELLVE